MIGRLSGQVVERGVDGATIVDVAGVGYEVFVPARLVSRLPAPPAATTLHVHTQVREDALTLYGFESERERQAFRIILGVSGVGPRIALAILSALSVDELAHAIAAGDLAALKGISGVGKKIAERLLLELKDKLPVAGPIHAPPRRTDPPGPKGAAAVVFGALVGLGYKPAQAEAALSALGDAEERPVEALLRDALARLA